MDEIKDEEHRLPVSLSGRVDALEEEIALMKRQALCSHESIDARKIGEAWCLDCGKEIQ